MFFMHLLNFLFRPAEQYPEVFATVQQPIIVFFHSATLFFLDGS
jgi:hypothetical protein